MPAGRHQDSTNSPENSVTSKLLSSGGARLLTLPFSAGCSLITAHIIFTHYGSARFAFVSLIASIVALLPTGDLGLGGAIIESISHDKTLSRFGLGQLTILSSMRVLFAMAGGLLIADGLTYFLGGWQSVLGAAAGAGTPSAAAAVAVGVLIFSMPISVAQRVLVGVQRTGLATALQAVAPPIALIVTAVAATTLGAHERLSISIAAVALPIGQVAAVALQAIAVTRVTPVNLFRMCLLVARPRSQPGSTVRQFAAPMAVISIGIPIALQCDRLVLAHTVSASALADYSVAAQLYLPIWAVLGSAGFALWPIFAHERRSSAAVGTTTLKQMLRIFGLAGVACATGFTCLAPAATNVISAGKADVGYLTAGLFGLLLLIQALQLPSGMYMTDAVGLRFQANTVALMVAVNLILSVVLAKSIGIDGPQLASAVAIIACQLIPQYVRVRRGLHSRSGSRVIAETSK